MKKTYKPALKIRANEVTDRAVWRQRRTLIKASMAMGLTGSIGASSAIAGNKLTQEIKKSPFSTDDEITSQATATSYNNFYELGTNKGDPAKNAEQLKTDPWSVVVDGECNKPGTYTLEDILKPHGIEERIYRHRCVEAWSMVIPWNGFSLGDLLKRFEPNGNAKYVAFETIYDPETLPGQRSRVLDWPYVEGLRMDEAMHPLAMMAIGMYGEEIPNQNGAPMRLIVPWKYGFKGIKSIVKISFTEKQPPTSWNRSAPHEYGFYSNVNPEVSHPRWSQAKERRLVADSGGLAALFSPKIDTEMLNGYADEVGSLYSDMDLKKFF
ncbi:MAG: protein-methionine-sulfoxide reductase catalytic subunit MsrP [Gammaproteobacteria bacterium]|nr:protein-methionine-sulfoxide reductase catalytic subunit MsrP [Gammaproteobacteria bacterium]